MVSLGKAYPPSEERSGTSPGKADSRIKQVLDVISEKIGYQIPHYAKEGAAVKRALKMGFSPEQFMACWEKLKTFAFWKGKWLPLAKVTENLGEFAAGRLEEEKWQKPQRPQKLATTEELKRSWER